ncbi:MAG: thiol-disulfide isomerase [Holophagales bacterium]|nr:thiol-disulfide isomerase [Holophagales bacterium]MYC10568.1 thiol-disulfide isomerase [Holophagales bacterium]
MRTLSVVRFPLPLLLLLAAGPAAADDVTFSRDVAPILNRHCVGCHRAGEIAPMSLATYREARPWARSIQRAVTSRAMPPWFAAPAVGEWANDPTLSEEEIGTIVAWVERGAPPGDPKLMPEPPRFTEGWQLGEPDYVIELPAVTVPADGPDLFLNQFVTIDIPERRWIRAVEFRPGAPRVNHHQLAFKADFTGMVEDGVPLTPQGALRASGSVDGRGYFNVLAMWGAGTAPTEFREGAGRWIEPGAVVVMNQHYHPNGEEQTDRTLIGLHFGEGELRSEIQAVIAGEMDFLIPAGAPDHRVEYRHEIARDSMIVSYLPHMHLRGKRMSYTAHYADGYSELLLEVPEYDFNWQLFYYPEKPKLVPAGTVVEIVAVYDNSTANPDNPDPTRDVAFGLQSTDEMMFGFFELVEVDGGP